MQCPLCKIVFQDVTSLLLHQCPSVKSSGVYPVCCWRNKITLQIEKDEKQRADFAFQMHQNYFFYLTKLVVPLNGPDSLGSTVLDTKSINEFIASPKISAEAILSQRLCKCDHSSNLPQPTQMRPKRIKC